LLHPFQEVFGMRSISTFVPTVGLVAALTATAAAQQAPAGDKDDQVVISGCVMTAGDHDTSSPRSLLVWSKGDVYLESATTTVKPSEHGTPVGTSGASEPIFYWIDDDDDLAKHAGHQVEIVGELSDELDEGEFEVDHDGEFTEIELDVNGKEAKARVPSAWLGPATAGKDSEFDVAVRVLDVERVNMTGSCRR
jgi:hypothetical protein